MLNLVPAPNGYTCPDDPGEPGLGLQRWSISDAEARIVAELLRGYFVLEIGTGLGVSTNKIAEKARWVYTVDIDPWVEKAIAPTLKENVTFFNSTTNVPCDVDGVFIDGLHTYNQCMEDITNSKRIVKKGGIFVFHDTKMPAIRSALISSGLEWYFIDTPAGLAIGWEK
jgi:ubiquinone/menaquinone biosynthesis C-methylase UbiE